jgi:hypothetical protein
VGRRLLAKLIWRFTRATIRLKTCRSRAEGIITGHPSMPEFKLDAGQVADVIAYLKSLER